MCNNSNLKTFCKVNQKLKNNYLIFLSSNSGTGKSTYFKWLLIRKAIKGVIKFDVFFRFENEIDSKFNDGAWLKPPVNASKRLLKLAEKVKIICEQGQYFLINTKTQEKLAQALAINTQKKYKSTENAIYTNFAFFDEVMPDDNNYCPDECYKFSRLIDTRARYRDYHVLCLYNNTRPYFLYRDYFGDTDALFIDFVGEKFGQGSTPKGIQGILSKSNYGEVYNNNSYEYYREFYRNVDTRNCQAIVSLSIQGSLFVVKSVGEVFVLRKQRKKKKNLPCLALGLQANDFELADRSNIFNFLTMIVAKRLIFCNHKKDTIFVKELADFCNIGYNI